MSPELLLRVQQASLGQSTTSLCDLAEQYIQFTRVHRSTETVKSRQSRIGSLVTFCNLAGIVDISQINNGVLEVFFEEYALTHKPSTVNATKKVFKSFFNWVEGYKELSTSVRANGIVLVKEAKASPKYIDDAIIQRVIDEPTLPLVDRLLVAVSARTGVRISELVGIRLKDIHGDTIHIMGKGMVDRTVYIPPSLQELLSAYLRYGAISQENDAPLFQTYRAGECRPISKKSAWARIKNAFLTVANLGMNPHRLRHSFAINLLVKGCDIVTIQKTLGHSDLKTTQKYLCISDDIIRSQINRYMQ